MGILGIIPALLQIAANLALYCFVGWACYQALAVKRESWERRHLFWLVIPAAYFAVNIHISELRSEKERFLSPMLTDASVDLTPRLTQVELVHYLTAEGSGENQATNNSEQQQIHCSGLCRHLLVTHQVERVQVRRVGDNADHVANFELGEPETCPAEPLAAYEKERDLQVLGECVRSSSHSDQSQVEFSLHFAMHVLEQPDWLDRQVHHQIYRNIDGAPRLVATFDDGMATLEAIPAYLQLFTSGMEGRPVWNIGWGKETTDYQKAAIARSGAQKRSRGKNERTSSADAADWIRRTLGLNATDMWRDKLYDHITFDTAERRLLLAVETSAQDADPSIRKMAVLSAMNRVIPVRDILPGEKLTRGDRVRYNFSELARRLHNDADPTVAERAKQYLEFREKERLRELQGGCCGS